MSRAKSPKIGISQRVMIAKATGEKRDALAQDWYRFLRALGVLWLPLPNNADAALDLARHFDLDGLILTGGDNIGFFQERDQAERSLLDWARDKRRPVVGVCRGFQMLQCWLGGALRDSRPELHKVKRHEVVFEGGARRVVNSYHNHAPDIADGPGPWEVLAKSVADGAVEAARAEGLFLGLMWHPEREAPDPADLKLFREHLHFQ